MAGVAPHPSTKAVVNDLIEITHLQVEIWWSDLKIACYALVLWFIR